MGKKQTSRFRAYKEKLSGEGPSRQTGDQINARNNDASFGSDINEETNIENVNRTGIGDAGWNDNKLSDYTQNHSADA